MIAMLSSVAFTMIELVRGSAVIRTISCASARVPLLLLPRLEEPPREELPPRPSIDMMPDQGLPELDRDDDVCSRLKTSLRIWAVCVASACIRVKTRILSSAEALTSITLRIRATRLIPSARPVMTTEFE